MDIDRAVLCRAQDRRRQDQPVGGDHYGIGAECFQSRFDLRRAQRLRLLDGEITRYGELLDCALIPAQAAARRPIGLGENERYFMSRIEEPRKRALGEGGCSRED